MDLIPTNEAAQRGNMDKEFNTMQRVLELLLEHDGNTAQRICGWALHRLEHVKKEELMKDTFQKMQNIMEGKEEVIQ